MENKWYTSSTGQGVSLTFKSLILALIPTIIFIGKQNGIEVTQEQIVTVVDQAISGAAAVGFCYGIARKVYYKVVKPTYLKIRQYFNR